MFQPFRQIMIMQMECMLQTLNLTKRFLEFYVSLQPQPAKVTSPILAAVPITDQTRRPSSRALVRLVDQR